MMNDPSLEIDFLSVETKKSGDAIPIRSIRNGVQTVYVVDGGYSETGPRILEHVAKYYGSPQSITHVVLTHPDRDHAIGLQHVLENSTVQNLWMHRPWTYADELIGRFPSYTSVDRLRSRLRALYPYASKLEELAIERGIPIHEAFQGTRIGEFTIVSPSRQFFLDLIVESERTPEGISQETINAGILEALKKSALKLIARVWGEETFSSNETSAENEMSIVQFANFEGTSFLLTGDAGRRSLAMAADYMPFVGHSLPGIDRFQIPHHGSRRNFSSELANLWLGPVQPRGTSLGFEAFVSSAKEDEDHPRSVVLRAVKHRGGETYRTEGKSLVTGHNRPHREGWTSAAPAPYPESEEE